MMGCMALTMLKGSGGGIGAAAGQGVPRIYGYALPDQAGAGRRPLPADAS